MKDSQFESRMKANEVLINPIPRPKDLYTPKEYINEVFNTDFEQSVRLYKRSRFLNGPTDFEGAVIRSIQSRHIRSSLV
jgi:hypothetical protein